MDVSITAQSQINETVKQTEDRVIGRMMTITCGCGREQSVVNMFQCLYCREWYCFPCAEQHFGMTVKEYRDKHQGERND